MVSRGRERVERRRPRALYAGANLLGDLVGVAGAARALPTSKEPLAADLDNAAWALLFLEPGPGDWRLHAAPRSGPRT